MAEIVKLTDEISYLKASENPLSADVVFIRKNNVVWIFDTGSSNQAAEEINRIQLPKNIVLSHFHQDHAANLKRITYDVLYTGAFKEKYFEHQTFVTEVMEFECCGGNAKSCCGTISIIPIVSCHAKGSLLLKYKDFLFLGDAIYPTEKAGSACYNSQQLLEEIRMLKQIDCENFCISHAQVFVKKKESVIAHLEEIYGRRKGNEPWIFV